jgi:hypothetical protein
MKKVKKVLKTNDQFKKDVIEKFGDKFNLDKVNYSGSHNKVTVICNHCGKEFEISATNLLSGKGCPYCAIEENAKKQRKTNEEIIEKIENKNHYDYDYSEIKFKNQHDDKCIIICHKKDKNGFEHGKFYKNLWHLYNGCGCPKCQREKEIKEAEKKFLALNKSKYELKIGSFESMKTYAIFIDENGNEFFEKPCNILHPNYISKIDKQLNKETNIIKHNIDLEKKLEADRKTKEENFIKKAQEMNGDKYDYGQVHYIKSSLPVKIYCNICGRIFEQTPNNHLRGSKCTFCVGKNRNTERFIEDYYRKYHTDLTFEKAEYINAHKKIIVTCPKHGDFEISPYHLLNGEGCPICKASKLEKRIKTFLDDNNINYIYQYNINWLGLQRLDFYLPDYKIAIECQGKQHFVENKFYFGANNGKENFQKTLDRDFCKFQKCKQNGVKLLYFYKKGLISKDILKEDKFNGIYEKNTFSDYNELLKAIKG